MKNSTGKKKKTRDRKFKASNEGYINSLIKIG